MPTYFTYTNCRSNFQMGGITIHKGERFGVRIGVGVEAVYKSGQRRVWGVGRVTIDVRIRSCTSTTKEYGAWAKLCMSNKDTAQTKPHTSNRDTCHVRGTQGVHNTHPVVVWSEGGGKGRWAYKEGQVGIRKPRQVGCLQIRRGRGSFVRGSWRVKKTGPPTLPTVQRSQGVWVRVTIWTIPRYDPSYVRSTRVQISRVQDTVKVCMRRQVLDMKRKVVLGRYGQHISKKTSF